MSIKTMVYQASTFYYLCYHLFCFCCFFFNRFSQNDYYKSARYSRFLHFILRTYINRRRSTYFFIVVYISSVAFIISFSYIYFYSPLTERYDNPLVYTIHTYVRTYIHTCVYITRDMILSTHRRYIGISYRRIYHNFVPSVIFKTRYY